MKLHATEDVHDPDRTLCGLDIYATECQYDNAAPTCGRCLRVIRSRCFDHGVRRCRVCPPGWYVLGGNVSRR